MTINQFTTANLKQVRTDMDRALQAVAKQHGITLRIGNIGFSGGEFRAKLEGTCEANVKQKLDAMQMYAGKAMDVSLIHEDKQGRRHRIVDFLPRRKKPWVTETQDGKQFCMTDEHARKWFAAHPEATTCPTATPHCKVA